MEKIFRKIASNRFSELKGTTIDATVPVPQSLVNELLVEMLRETRNIESLNVFIHPENRVALDVKTTLLPWTIHLKLKVDKALDFASYSSPKMRTWMENNRLLGSLGSLFRALPGGIRIYGDQIVIDLGVFLREPEERQLLSLVKSVSIRTEEGRVILDVKIEVNE